jgi:hypothetical protein
MATTQKAISISQEFASEFKQRSSLAQTAGFSATDGGPTLLVGAATAGAEGFFLKISLFANLNKDALGLTQNTYANHIAQIAYEANPSSGSGADVEKWASHLPAIAMLAMRGIRIEVYEETNGTAPSETTIAAAKLKASFEPHVQYPQMASQ